MRLPILFSALFLLCAGASGQQPAIVNARVSTEPGSLSAALATAQRAAAPVWLGYSVPVLEGFDNDWSRSRTQFLERDGYWSSHEERAPNAQSAGSGEARAIYLIRVANGAVTKLRPSAPGQQLDAGGLSFTWLSGVTPEESVAVLRQIALRPGSRNREGSSIDGQAVLMIALERSSAVMPALTGLVAAGNEPHLREQTAFWLANQRGEEGFTLLRTLARNDADAAFREKLTFDFTLTKSSEAVAELIRMAHEDASPRVRRQAQFWMAQVATRPGGQLVAANLRESAENDPDRANRKQAVFAISRLPAPQAAAELRRLAETSKDPEVRKQAVFWLGQSSDPQALAYLDKLLSTPKP